MSSPRPFWPDPDDERAYDEPESILEHLGNRSVVSVVLSDDDTTVNFTDGCDAVFSAGLNKDRLGRLIAELQEMHGRMKT